MDIDNVMTAVCAQFPVPVHGASKITVEFDMITIAWTAFYDVYVGEGGTCADALKALVADIVTKSAVRRDDASALIAKITDLQKALASVLV